MGTRVKVFVAERLDPGALARLRDAGFDVVQGAGQQGAELVSALGDAQALIVRGATKVTAEVLNGAAGLKLVVRAGSGLDNVDAAAARARGIEVRNTPAANAVSVAELVFGLLIALERQLETAAASLRAGRWERAKLMGHELAGRRLSLIGFGRIGREVAVRARAFEMPVIAYDPLLEAWPAEFAWVPKVTLEQAIERADVLSLHVPLTKETRGMIDAHVLARLPEGAVLVNLARGGLVDEDALCEALDQGRLRGAALDVFSTEPPGAHPLIARPDVVVTPHLGASTHEAQRRAGEEAAAIVIESLARIAR